MYTVYICMSHVEIQDLALGNENYHTLLIVEFNYFCVSFFEVGIAYILFPTYTDCG